MSIHQQDIKPRFEVVDRTDETITVDRWERDNDKGMNVCSQVEVPYGYDVFFPNGNSMRVASKEELDRLGFGSGPEFIDMNTGEAIQMQTSLRRSRSHRASTKSKDASE